MYRPNINQSIGMRRLHFEGIESAFVAEVSQNVTSRISLRHIDSLVLIQIL